MQLTRVRGWVGAGLAEAAGRLVILSGTTAYLAHVLEPGDFGATALVFSIVTIFSVCVAGPYEEALAQRRVVRRLDLQAALAVSLVAALAFIVAALPIGAWLDRIYGRSDMAWLLPATTTLLLAQAPLVIATAVARRRKAFYAIHVASLAAHVMGAAAAIGLALAGAGIWALAGLRIATVAGNFVVLAALLGLWLVPAWSWTSVRAMNGFAGYILLTRLVENSTYLIYNAMVGSLFGLTVLGYANLAMRLIEPLRGAIVAITHNLCFSFFTAGPRRERGLGEGACRISAESTVLIAPTFMGIAAISPILVPLIAGPGWDAAVPIVAAFAAGGMLALPSQVVQTALSVTGKPQHILSANAAGLAALVVVLAASAGLDPIAVGVARLASDLVQTAATLAIGGRLIALPQRTLLRQLAGSWCAATVMALAVAWLGRELPASTPVAVALGGAVAGGVAVYAVLLFVLARQRFTDMRRMILAGLRPAAA